MVRRGTKAKTAWHDRAGLYENPGGKVQGICSRFSAKWQKSSFYGKYRRGQDVSDQLYCKGTD